MLDLTPKQTRPKPSSLLALGVLLFLGMTPQPCLGQAVESKAPAPVTAPVSLQQIQIEIKNIQGSKELEEPLKNKLLDLYQSAKDSLEASQAYMANAEVHKQSGKAIPAQLEKLKKSLGKVDTERTARPVIRVPDDAPLQELEQRLLKEQAELASIEGKLLDLDKQLQGLKSRPDQARKQLTEAKKQQGKIEEDLKTLPPDEPPMLAKARKTDLQARQQARMTEIQMLDQELLIHGIRAQLVTAQRDLAARNDSRAQARVKFLQELTNQRRQAEAEQVQTETSRAESEAAGKHPAIRKLAERNAELSMELSNTVTGLEHSSASRESLDAQLKQIEQDSRNTRQWLEKAGLSAALGQVLRDQRRKLLDLRRYRKGAEERQTEIAKASLGQFRIEEMQRELGEFEPAVERIMGEQVEAALPEKQRQEIEAEVRKLLKDQQELLRKLSTSQTKYLWALGDLDATQKQLVHTARQYTAFLDEHLLWNPSASALGMTTLGELLPATGWLLSPAGWENAARSLLYEIRDRPLLAMMALLLFSGLLWFRRRRWKALESIARHVQAPHSDRFTYTLEATAVSLLAAAPWPLLVGLVAWQLQASGYGSEFTKAVGSGLSVIVVPLLLMLLLRAVCLDKGMAIVHFGWREQVAMLWRRHLSWLIPVFLPGLFISTFAGWQGGDGYGESLGRLGFMISMVALAVFFQLVLKPKGGVLEHYLLANPKVWLSRFRYQWYAAAVGAPLILAALAAAGYYYTALQLKVHFFSTLGLVFGVFSFHGLVVRWLVVSERKLSLLKFQEKMEAESASREAAGEAAPVALDTPEVGLETIDTHIRKLLRTVIGVTLVVGLWLIWTEAFPALSILDDVTLWQHSVMQDGREILQAVTLADLAVAIVLALVTFGATRNLPGVLEIAVLSHLSLEPGSRYAITTISRYVIATIGIVVVCNALGLSWSKVQWLVAAMGVGLGFGLQEIVANFVSGLIILFERPIRVGDTVTINDVSGTVTRIRIRATTITDWDRKELVVPNKAFITGSLVNWTLSDPITRVVIPVGIAYGSDIALAHKEMLKVVKSLPLVLEEPEASVYFIGFGDSSLDFVVRAFVKDLDSRLPLIHQLHMNIEKALREHGIEIPFPQRDVHVRSVVAEEDRIGPEASSSGPKEAS